MKRALNVTALLAMGFLVASSSATAQQAPQAPQAPASSTGGQVTVGVLAASDVDSSKFDEYRDVPKGVSLPCLQPLRTTSTRSTSTCRRTTSGRPTSATPAGSTPRRSTCRSTTTRSRTTWATTARRSSPRRAPGVWGMSDTLQQALGTHRQRDADRRPDRTRSTTTLLAPDLRVRQPRRRLALAQAGRRRARPRQEAALRPDLHVHAGAQVRLSRRQRRRHLRRRPRRSRCPSR